MWSSGVELQAGCGVTPPPPPPAPPRHDDKAGVIRSSDCLSHSAGGAVGSNWVAGITWNWDVGDEYSSNAVVLLVQRGLWVRGIGRKEGRKQGKRAIML